MNIKDLLGMQVLDSDIREIGKVKDAEFDEATGKLLTLKLGATNNLFSNDETTISYDDVEKIGSYVLTKISADDIDVDIS